MKSQNRKYFETEYANKGIGGEYKFHIEIDPENKITELYKDNNDYEVLYCKGRYTQTNSVTSTSVELEIVKFDGAYITAEIMLIRIRILKFCTKLSGMVPDISIRLLYKSLLIKI